MKEFSVSNSILYSIIQLQILINVLAGIRKYWWENFSKINKRTGTTIPDSSNLCNYLIIKFD